MDIDKTSQLQLASYAIMTQREQDPLCNYGTAVRMMADEPSKVATDLFGITSEMVLEWCRQGGPGRVDGLRELGNDEGQSEAHDYYMCHEAQPRESRAHLLERVAKIRAGAECPPHVSLITKLSSAPLFYQQMGIFFGEDHELALVWCAAYDAGYIAKLESLGEAVQRGPVPSRD